jgi:hypothetical protein
VDRAEDEHQPEERRVASSQADHQRGNDPVEDREHIHQGGDILFVLRSKADGRIDRPLQYEQSHDPRPFFASSSGQQVGHGQDRLGQPQEGCQDAPQFRGEIRAGGGDSIGIVHSAISTHTG